MIAHLRLLPDGQPVVQTLAEHSQNTARYAAENLAPVGLSSVGRLAGLLHDAGKATRRFEDYITAAARGEKVARGSVIHTFAGLILLFERVDPQNGVERLTRDVIACAVASHHGLLDCLDPDGADGFLHRLEYDRQELAYDEARSNFLREVADGEEIDRLFAAATAEVRTAVGKIRGLVLSNGLDTKDLPFLFGMLTRLVTSALIDADRRDTAEFYGVRTPTFDPPDVRWTAPLAALENNLRAFSTEGPINRARAEISNRCREAAERSDQGIFRLNVPTGAGKTLSALRFGLTHAKRLNKQHIFYVAPLLSILEQNADVIRKAVGDPSLVLEHHSNVAYSKTDGDELGRYELLAERWDCPIIVTTMVQFLNTLFSAETSCVRRMHALADSVIVVDEIQSLPHKTVELTNMAMNFLAHVCGATVLLCSATQPCLEAVKHPLILSAPPDLIPPDPVLFAPFNRVRFVNRTQDVMDADRIAQTALERLNEPGIDSVLVICNTRRTAGEVYQRLSESAGASDPDSAPFVLLHLSASMCPAHRRDVLDRIGKPPRSVPVVCVSTQVVEAGMDVSFGCVIRALAGLDSVAQAAGRCNRSGEYGRLCEVDVIRVASALENLDRLPDIWVAGRSAEAVLNGLPPEDAGSVNLLDDTLVSAYYRNLYREVSTQYPWKRQKVTLFELLSENGESRQYERSKNPYRPTLRQAFRTAGEAFTVFDENTEDVIVPYNSEAKELIAELGGDRAKNDLAYAAKLIAKAKPYTVSVYKNQLKSLRERGAIGGDGLLTLAEGYYHESLGLVLGDHADSGAYIV